MFVILLICRKWLFFFVVASFWFNTIIHLFFTFCDSLSNDKYEKKRSKKKNQTSQYSFEKAYCAIKRKRNECDNIVSRKRIVQLSITIAISLLQWRIFSEFVIEQCNFEKAYNQYVTIWRQIISLRENVLYSQKYV